MRTNGIVLGAAVLSAVFTFAACGSDPTCADDDTCDAPGGEGGPETSSSSGGEGGMDGPMIDAPPGCDLTKEPKDAPACVDDGVGVFVDATKGDDSGKGTKAAPYRSIGKAAASAGQKRVYVCEGDYAENVKLTGAASIYGGFACGGWSYSGKKANVAPSSGYALEIAEVTGSVEVADVRFASAAGTSASPNSIAVFAHGSASVTLRRAELEAAAGADGASGDPGVTGTADKTLAGESGNGTTAGPAKTCTCTGGITTSGGSGGAVMGAGGGGAPALGGAAPNDGAGGLGNTSCVIGEPNGSGNIGTDAPNAADAPKGTSKGALDAKGWVAQAGAAGDNGKAGQGGGGGGGRGGAGGGGACGGCGGTGGKGGGAGGASVALLAVNAPVKIVQSTLTSAKAGNGGTGGAGGGGGGGGGGAVGGAPDGCGGGDGGKGGNGGAGSGGAGGISAAILSKGGKPTAEASMLKPGAKGDLGAGGIPGTNDGVDGESGESIEVQ